MIPPCRSTSASWECCHFVALRGSEKVRARPVDRELMTLGRHRPMGFMQLDALLVPSIGSIKPSKGQHSGPLGTKQSACARLRLTGEYWEGESKNCVRERWVPQSEHKVLSLLATTVHEILGGTWPFQLYTQHNSVQCCNMEWYFVSSSISLGTKYWVHFLTN